MLNRLCAFQNNALFEYVLCFLKVKALQASLTVAEMEIIEYKVEIEHLKCALLSREVEFVVLFSEEESSTL